MRAHTVTEKDGVSPEAPGDAVAVPGLLLVWSVHEPRAVVLRLRDGKLELGRDELLACGVHDARVSRQHLFVEYDGGRFTLRDSGSTNGSFLDGKPLSKMPARLTPHDAGAAVRAADASPSVHVLRIGRTVMIPFADVTPFERTELLMGEVVMGPMLRAAHQRLSVLSAAGESVMLTGESGVGKEVAARAYHAATLRARGPFVAVNCATIPRELAEGMLFGARRGAYSGAVTDSEGLLLSAHGGTMFFDEIGELELSIQAKLLRVLETRQVLALGATRPRAVDLRVCAATLVNLEEMVASRRFREDLYFRIGRPTIKIPPLRERPEEVAALVDRALRSLPQPAPKATAALIDACLLRAWPGNVRELHTEVRTAGLCAIAAGHAEVDAHHLDGAGERAAASPRGTLAESDAELGAEQIIAALRQARGNLSAAAQALAVPRTTLYRLVEQHGIDRRSFRGPHRT